ncbi:tryptophan-rich sensory protein, partial [Plectonema cf. radiosum LEGE 06105]
MENSITSSSKFKSSRPFKWWHAVLILLFANLISAIPAGYNGEEAFYNNFTLPAIAPPDWLFAPVWLFNNITSLIGLYITANLRVSQSKKVFYWAEGISWVLFAVFTILYFGLKSPILGALDTALGLVATTISFIVAYKINKKASLFILPRLL